MYTQIAEKSAVTLTLRSSEDAAFSDSDYYFYC